jgi:SpoVK/Ycf46/Vps4 family AAA+-type ATPase
VKKLITPITDFFRRTRKENFIGNIRPEGNMNARMPSKQTIYDPTDVARTTIKEQTIDNDYQGALSANKKAKVYDPTDTARTTIKEQTIDNDYQGALTGSKKAKIYGLPSPRGVLLIGIQGTGKSLTSKAIANEWKLPLLKLDVGRLFAGIVGESENRIREMIKLSEALAPCVLWIDEIDKAFSEQSKNFDSGTTNRLLGTFITWLSEKESKVFIVATANNFSVLPLELVRKGRFDEIFFIDLPNLVERKKIFEVILKRLRSISYNLYDINQFSDKSKGFSGAEIEQAIIEGMHIAFNEKREFNTLDILNGLDLIIPLSQINSQRIKQIQSLALSGQIRLAS